MRMYPCMRVHRVHLYVCTHVQGEIYLKMHGALGFHTAVMHLRAAYSLASRVHAVSKWWVVV